MLGALILAAMVSVSPADYEPLIATWVDAMRREDRLAARGLRPLKQSLGTSYDRLLIYDRIDIESYRIVSVEPRENETLITIEMIGTAIEAHTGRHVPWPRWWSLNVLEYKDNWAIDTPMTLERRLADDYDRASPEELSALIQAHPEIDLEAFMVHLAIQVLEHGKVSPCPTLLWIAREGAARGRADLESIGYQYLSYLATLDPIDAGDAIESARRGVQLAEATGSADSLSDAYSSLGEAYAVAGRIDEALQAYRQSARHFSAAADPREAQRALHAAAQLEIDRNHLREALADAELYQKRLGQGVESPRTRMRGALQIGTIHERLGNTELARHYYEEARALAIGQRDPTESAYATYKVAEQAIAMGELVEARQLLEHALTFTAYSDDPEVFVPIFTALAAIHRQQGNFAEADEALTNALAVIGDRAIPPQMMADLHVERSLLRLAEGRPDVALADARTARNMEATPHADAMAAEGRALRALRRGDEAERVLRAAIDVVETELTERPLDETGSAAVLQQQLVSYRELLGLLIESGCAREALTVAERMRARSLRDSLRNGRVDLSAGLDEAQREREKQLESAIAGTNRQLLAATDAGSIRRLQRERNDARMALRRFRSELYVVHPELVHRRAQTPEQHEQWQLHAEPGELALELAVTDEATFLFVLEGANVTVRRIGLGRDALEAAVDAFVDAIEQRDLAWRKPARALYDLLLGSVAPEIGRAKAIRIVPDGALWRLPFHALLDGGGQHLIDRLPVTYSPSLVLLRMPATPRAAAERTLLAYADPVIPARTAETTRALYRDIGLSWAFLAAGVPTTVVSQWKVASASTADLMIAFHRGLRDGTDAATALRTAMTDIRRDPRWRHPFYWAPFVVVENGGAR